MYNRQSHRMDLEKTYPDGDEVWHCPTCGRRMIVKWEPFQKTILECGDEYASHSGSKGGLQINSVQVSQSDESNLRSTDVWLNGLEGVDFDGL